VSFVAHRVVSYRLGLMPASPSVTTQPADRPSVE
jgi:hypothetical protein